MSYFHPIRGAWRIGSHVDQNMPVREGSRPDNTSKARTCWCLESSTYRIRSSGRECQPVGDAEIIYKQVN